ncbi:hypothetical protein FT663_00649 [Candidozyma haemuli var. vulneris]|uniref:Probable vacuolar protein sorting-associated protein 16 homolog n=1 Tax=Candidozyma haemuli TaxID=45357 RepID=A0A2V1AP86_9ASCO|nr:hypothetical protein CXQ85_003432 [[Candida] haemuloni]KAF3990804.1 hypothetical protein FT662_02068 [[Candida] haemuloni var. vulneris]KAF3995271.1 hypothetical protein FT663_00649 [[Candida] haemuloni var. vulneris]PVH19585.1 hypothetical protein CXQ85_003432 [[Candida] haemuloni]
MLSSPSLTWQKLHDVYYSIRTCYDSLNWSIDNLHANYRVAISTNTTLMALASRSANYPNVIDVYSISGNKLWSVIFNSTPQEHIVDFAFRGEDLIVVLSSGKYRLYTDFQGTFNEYSFTENLTALGDQSDDPSRAPKYVITNLENNETEEAFDVVEAQVWDQILVLRHKNRITFSRLDTFQNYDLSLDHLDLSQVHCMALIASDSQEIEFLLGYSNTIYIIKISLATQIASFDDQKLTDGPFTKISTSHDGSLISIFNAKSSKIYVVRKSFDRVLLEYDTSNESSAPFMIEWAGNDAIILSLRDEIKLVGPDQISISFFYDIVDSEEFDLDHLLRENPDSDLSFTIPIIKSEPDGLRIITPNKVEFLSRVSQSSINIHSVGSSHPSQILLDCVDKLKEQSSKADTNISLLKSEKSLREAMAGCLDAVLHEFDPQWQKAILKAVSFGKIYDNDYYNAEEYLEVVNIIKVLDQLRSPEYGIFLTYQVVTKIGWESVIKMLLRRHAHLLALKVIALLQMPDLNNLVYSHWCCCKIRKELNLSDFDLFKIVAKKLISLEKNTPGDMKRNHISVIDISNVAYQEGRVDLCKLLINLEPSMLAKMKEYLMIEETELALVKTFQAGDLDLCRLLLLHLQDSLPKLQLFKILNQNEQSGLFKDTPARQLLKDEEIKVILQDNLFVSGDLIGNFWVQNIAKYNASLIDSYYKHESKSSERSIYKVKKFLKENDDTGNNNYEEVFQVHKQKLHSLLNNSKYTKLIQRELAILELKKKLSEMYQTSFFGAKALTDILVKLIKMHQIKTAGKIVKDQKLPQEKLWHLVLEVYSKIGEFERLHKFLTSNSSGAKLKSPIGMTVIAETCITYGAPKAYISVYISSITDASYDKIIELYLKIGDFKQAAQEAFNNKDGVALQSILKKARGSDEDTISAIKDYISRV